LSHRSELRGWGMKNYPQLVNILIGFLLGVVALLAINLISAPARGLPIELIPPPTPQPLRIHVNGAIENPGVYTLPAGSIVQDAISQAGGITASADLSNTNLASPLADGQLVYIYSTSETDVRNDDPTTSANPNTAKINLNTASVSDLESLPGIGPSLAEEIVNFRSENGPFETVENLLEVSGIGPVKLEQLRDYVLVR
jgi:competence protein ComEA